MSLFTKQKQTHIESKLTITEGGGGGAISREFGISRYKLQLQFSHPSCPTLCDPWTAARQASLSITSSWSLLKLMSIESVMPPNHLILCRPLLLLPSIPPSIRVFSNESVLCIRWPKYWGFSFNTSPSNEHPGVISFRMDWFDLLLNCGVGEDSWEFHVLQGDPTSPS